MNLTDFPDEQPPRSRCSSGNLALHHYSSFYGLTGIVSSKSLWCSKIQYLNDASELRHGFDTLIAVAKEFANINPALASIGSRVDQVSSVNVFVCSFSEEGDLLSQWRGYAGGGGVSIAFSFEKLKGKAISNGYTLGKCIYDSTEKMAITRRYVQKMIAQKPDSIGDEDYLFTIASRFIPIAARFKQAGFREEQEWRLVSPLIQSGAGRIRTRPTDTGLVPYTAFDLRTNETPLVSEAQPWRTDEHICIDQVVVGPNREQELQMSSVMELFSSHRCFAHSVGRSSIPFRVM